MLCTQFQLFQALFNVKLYYQLPIWLIVAFKVITLTNYVNQFSLNLFSWFSHPRKPRGGQLGQEKRRRKFSRTGERTPEMLFLKNQFHDLFECLSVIAFCAKSEVIFLYERVYLQTRLFAVLQAFQAQVTSVECKFTFSQESRCGVTGNRWNVVREIKYWGLKCFLFSWPNRPQLGLRGWIFFPVDDHLP